MPKAEETVDGTPRLRSHGERAQLEEVSVHTEKHRKLKHPLRKAARSGQEDAFLSISENLLHWLKTTGEARFGRIITW